MTARRPPLREWQHPGLRAALLAIALLLGLAAVRWLDVERRQAEEALLTRDLDALSISWSAVQSLERNSVITYFEEYVSQPRTLELLTAAQDPATRDRARLQLFRHLSAVYERLVERGVRQFHFHLPNGDSLLRFHFPARFGDNLSEARESIRRVNAEKVPVFGFEVGRVVSGFRSVFPISTPDGQHLGSVELSMPFKVMLEELQALMPTHSFELLLDAGRQRDILFEEQQSLFEAWPASDRFLVEDPQRIRPDSPPPLPDDVRLLVSEIGNSEDMVGPIAASAPSAQSLSVGGHHYAVLSTAVYDPGGYPVARLVAYAREPALKTLNNAYTLRLGIALATLLALAGAAYLLVRALGMKLAERERLREITDTVGQGLYLCDASGRMVSMNPYGCEMLGYEQGQVIGEIAHDLLHRHADNGFLQAARCPIRQSIAAGQEFRGETVFERADGSKMDVQVVSRPLKQSGRLVGEVVVFEDIEQRKRLEHQLEHNAHYDALTGLPNRVLLADRLEQAMQRTRRFGDRIAVAFIDLDRFKPVNDRYGHDAGDRLLVELSERMRRNLRAVDTLARIGGDEFVAVLGAVGSDDDTLELVDRLLESVQEPVAILEGTSVQVGASIGLTFYPQAEELDPDQLLRQADQAMYQAKQRGRNSWHLFDLQLDSAQRDQLARIDRVRSGLANNEFELYYQPLVNLRTGRLVGVEALIRWNHPELGLLSPDAFLPDIEGSATGIALGNWVLARAIGQRAEWEGSGADFSVCVNVSPHHLQQDSFSDDLERILDHHPDLPRGTLEIEILEGTALSEFTRIAPLIGYWRDRGVRFAIDDFGTGYSSLSYLKRLPVATLKVDRSFVNDINTDADNLPILEGVAALGRAFTLHTVAEGVETREQAGLLLQLGYDVAQGYGIARPMTAGALEAWLKAWTPDPEWSSMSRLAPSEYPVLYALVAAQGEAAAFTGSDDRSTWPAGTPAARRHLDDCLARRRDWPDLAGVTEALARARHCLDALYRARGPDGPLRDVRDLQADLKKSLTVARTRLAHRTVTQTGVFTSSSGSTP